MLAQSVDQDEKADFEVASPSTGESRDRSFSKDVEAVRDAPLKESWALRWTTRLVTRPKSKTESPTQPDKGDWSTLTRNLDVTPEGYAATAAFQSSDRNFLQYRGFRYLHSRVLLDLQYSIERLEEELDALDQYDKDEARARRLQCTEDDRFWGYDYPEYIERARPAVLQELKDKLLEYDTVLLKTREMSTLQRPAKRDYESVKNFFKNEGPMTEQECRFIRRKEDMVTLRCGRESATFDGFVESCLQRTHNFMDHYFGSDIVHRWFLTEELRGKSTNKYIDYFSPAKIDTLVNIIITMVIFILLVLPVVVMYKVTEMGKSQSPLDAIGVLIVFTLIFGMAVASLTTAKRHELFGASAAYAAVLVVFIGNFGVQQVDPASTDAWMTIFAQNASR